MLDILIKNGSIVDGSGSDSWVGDIGIKEGKIVCIDRNIAIEAKKTINVAGKIVAPGFIDLHSHSDLMILDDAFGEIKLQQGVTTEFFGNCGFSASPTSEATLPLLQEYSEPIMGALDQEWAWQTYDEYIKILQKDNHIYNIGGFVGNGTLRIAVKGFEAGALTRQEIEKVKNLLREALEAGAFGLSIGLMYVPENYYMREQLVEICKVVKEFNGVVTAHIRGEGNSLIQSIKEVIYIAKETKVSLHISHLKAAGKNNWGSKCDEAIHIIEKVRNQGMDVTCDVYPYTAGSTTLTSLLPPWVMEGGVEKTVERLKTPSLRKKVYDELNQETDTWDNLVYSTGWENVVVSSVNTIKNQVYVGKNIAEITVIRGQDPIDCALDIMVEEQGNVSIVFFHMSEEDVIKIMKLNHSLIISDSLFSAQGLPHPRLYGSFPRLFAKYVREKEVLTVEEAVRKVTSLPAARMGLKDRGLLQESYIADIVIFDLDIIEDCATYINPRQYPKGIEYVMVGGEIVLEKGNFSGQKNGCVLSTV